MTKTKKKMATLLLLFSVWLAFSCATGAGGNKNNGLKLVQATSQRFAGGIKGSSRGTRYEFVFVAGANSTQLQINEVWIGDKYFKAEPARKYKAPLESSFAAKDTIYISVTDIIRDESTDAIDSSKKPPYPPKGKALIAYTCKNKVKYLDVTEIVEKPKLNYQ